MQPEHGPEGPCQQSRLTHEEQQQLVIEYGPLVNRVARTLPLEIPGVLEYEDAVGYGTCGLVEAVRRYDPTRGTNFHAYAVRRIRGAMIDAFRRMDRLSRTMRQKARDIQRAQSELQLELNRTPTEAETAEHMGVSLRQFRNAAANSTWVTVSLDRMLDKDADRHSSPRAEMPTAEADLDITLSLDARELVNDLSNAVEQIPARERYVVALYYVEQLTMKDIARILNVTETRISQLHARAIKRLRKNMTSIAA